MCGKHGCTQLGAVCLLWWERNSTQPVPTHFPHSPHKLIPSCRYMERQLRENIGFDGTPLRLLWRGKPEREKGSVRVGAKEGAAGAQASASGGSGGGGRGGGGRGGSGRGGGGKGGRGGRGSGRR